MTAQPILTRSAFARDMLQGLSQSPKVLSSKYFYDEYGDRLFQQIMHMPEYYLTDCEFEIFEDRKEDILAAIGPEPFDLIELGAGDGLKTKILLRHFLSAGVDFVYRPIDISGHALRLLSASLAKEMPKLSCRPAQGDYFQALAKLDHDRRRRQVILFPGANIGNFTKEEATAFLTRLSRHLAPGDLLFIGFDLMKDPAIILAAYNDPAGITAAFNLNLLARMNRELGANFQLDQFRHWEVYNPITGEARSYIVSNQAQRVDFPEFNRSVDFAAWEALHVEISKKYSLPGIEALARETGFTVEKNFLDKRQYFVDSLWRFGA